MKHRVLTCKNHPKLRWSCKDISWTNGHGFNSKRNLFFNGTPSGRGMYSDGSGLDCTKVKDGTIVEECSCPPADLILAEEDKLVRQNTSAVNEGRNNEDRSD